MRDCARMYMAASSVNRDVCEDMDMLEKKHRSNAGSLVIGISGIFGKDEMFMCRRRNVWYGAKNTILANICRNFRLSGRRGDTQLPHLCARNRKKKQMNN